MSALHAVAQEILRVEPGRLVVPSGDSARLSVHVPALAGESTLRAAWVDQPAFALTHRIPAVEGCLVELLIAPDHVGVRALLIALEGTDVPAVRVDVEVLDPADRRPWVEPPGPEDLALHPADRIGDSDPRWSPYTDKERNIIPLDFEFRYAHHDVALTGECREALGRRVLHLGCNAGVNSIILARRGLLVHGVDVQARALAEALRLRAAEPPEVARRVTFQLASFGDMQLPDGYFDSAIAFDVLEHVYPDDLAGLLERVRAALRPGGVFLAHVPRGGSFDDPAHVRRFEPDVAREDLRRALDVVLCRVHEEGDAAGNQRIDLLATAPFGRRDPAALESRFWTGHYTPARARERLGALLAAVEERRPFSMVRIGDAEARFLAFGRLDLGHGSLRAQAAEAELHLGVPLLDLGLDELHAAQEEFAQACREADVLGTHRRTVNRAWGDEADRVLPLYGLDAHPHELDVVFNAEILDQGYLLPLLERRRVLLVGNAAPEFAHRLSDPVFRAAYRRVGMPLAAPEIVRAIGVPHAAGAAFARLEDLWQEVCSAPFDLALIAASVTGKLLAGRIRRELGRVALDVGWTMQYLADRPSPVAPSRSPGRRGFDTLFSGRRS